MLVSKVGPSSSERMGLMRILYPRLFLGICGAACLIAFSPEGRRPPAEVAAFDQSAVGSEGARVGAPSPPHAPDAGARLTASNGRTDGAAPAASASLGAIRPPPPEAPLSHADPSVPPAVGLNSACCVGPEPGANPSPLPEEVARSDADLAAQFAYADVPGPAPAVGALSAIAPTTPATSTPGPALPAPPPR